MSAAQEHPETAEMDVPAADGTLLHLVMNRESDTGRFTYASAVEVQEHTPHGLRPLAAYSAGAFIWAPRDKGFGLDGDRPGLRIDGHWLITVSDWINMFGEASVDIWGVDAP